MIECSKRQKVIRKGVTIYRCLLDRKEVSESECLECPRWQRASTVPVPVPVPVPVQYPPTTLQAMNYAKALKAWVAAGRPKRSDEEVEQILVICQGCDWYDPSQKRCKGCGCKVTKGAWAVLNKAKMATEHCPQGRW